MEQSLQSDLSAFDFGGRKFAVLFRNALLSKDATAQHFTYLQSLDSKPITLAVDEGKTPAFRAEVFWNESPRILNGILLRNHVLLFDQIYHLLVIEDYPYVSSHFLRNWFFNVRDTQFEPLILRNNAFLHLYELLNATEEKYQFRSASSYPIVRDESKSRRVAKQPYLNISTPDDLKRHLAIGKEYLYDIAFNAPVRFSVNRYCMMHFEYFFDHDVWSNVIDKVKEVTEDYFKTEDELMTLHMSEFESALARKSASTLLRAIKQFMTELAASGHFVQLTSNKNSYELIVSDYASMSKIKIVIVSSKAHLQDELANLNIVTSSLTPRPFALHVLEKATAHFDVRDRDGKTT